MKLNKSLISTQKYVDCYNSDIIFSYIQRVCDEMVDKYCNGECDGYNHIRAAPYVFLEADNENLYDSLISDKDASVVGEKLQSRKVRTICFPQYDVTLEIKLDLSCDLMPEDMALFEAMGKVEVEYHQATVSKTVYCEIPSNQIPF